METLPAVRDEGGIPAITSNPLPPAIIKHLDPFAPDEALLRTERARYATLQATEATKAVRAAHDALEEGRVLIDLETTLIGCRYERFPRLAIGHLTDETVWCRIWTRTGRVEYRNRLGGRKVFYEFEEENYVEHGAHEQNWIQRQAHTPTLPPEITAKVSPKDPNLLLLWEADWKRESEYRWTPPVVRDPALLEHVAGSLYAVVAVWELSPIEAAALGKKAR